jgi:hypothetical protein
MMIMMLLVASSTCTDGRAFFLNQVAHGVGIPEIGISISTYEALLIEELCISSELIVLFHIHGFARVLYMRVFGVYENL